MPEQLEGDDNDNDNDTPPPISLSHTVKSVEVLVTNAKGDLYLFQVPKLYDEITKATVKYAPEKKRITVSLTKKSAFSWANLHRQG